MPSQLSQKATKPTPSIIDIRRDVSEVSLKKAIIDGLNTKNGEEKHLSTLLLYDEAGLKLFEEITYLEEYYPTSAEIEVLEKDARHIAECIQDDSIILELGSGNLRKVKILLNAIDKAGKHDVQYYALDLSETELERTLAAVPRGTFEGVQCHGLFGTYDDGLEWLKRPEIRSKAKTVFSLGSSIGNFSRTEAAEFLHSFSQALDGPHDALLIGLDGCKDHDRVWHAYNDKEGVTKRFYQGGLLHANAILGYDAFKLDQWDIVGIYNEAEGRHEAFIEPLVDVTIEGALCQQGERIRIEDATKYSETEAKRLWRQAGLMETHKWSNAGVKYAIHMLQKHNIYACPAEPADYAPKPAPTLEEWEDIWVLWDTVTRKMLPNEELLEKPIKLRNACIFYLGHIPTFFDMKITAETDGKHTEPEQYTRIFERGIDPDVENPEQCHAHSEIPDEWPPLEDILQFQDRVRERIKNLYSSGQAQSPKVARVLWLGYEHEAMHLETLLYMLIQSEKTLSPPDCARPNFEVEAEQAKTEATKNEWFTIPEQDIILGIDDPDNEYGPSRHFGWDVEKPARQAHVKSFVARGRPITNGEYAEYLSQTNTEKIPASWIEKQLSNGHTNGTSTSLATYLANKAVRTVYGPVPLVLALDWPVTASYDEINACAAYMGGRIPTLEETRSIYHYAQTLSTEKTSNAMTSAIPAVNGHLVHNGVTETPPPQLTTGPTKGSSEGEVEVRKRNLPNPEDVFLDLTGANVGFQRWCPTAVTPFGNKLAGQGHMGGVWEWTASPLKRHEGYEEMRLYPAYSSDFFDDKHNVVLGGSWATVPRIAGRKSFVNWYQRNYPYVWAGARVVKDL